MTDSIHQSEEMESDLLHHPNQLHSPIYSIPPEITSLIFLQLYNSRRNIKIGATGWEEAPSGIHRHAITLSSVSTQWRQIAFATTKLWERLSLQVGEGANNANRVAALLLHYASHANYLYIRLSFVKHEPFSGFSPGDISALAEALFSPEITQKVQTLSLYAPPSGWLPKLSSFPALTTLALADVTYHRYPSKLQLESLPLSRVFLQGDRFELIILPPSVEVLHLEGTPSILNMALLYQCPNLVECKSISVGRRTFPFATNLTLGRLKTLIWAFNEGFSKVESIQRLRMPAIESLHITSPRLYSPETIIMLCHQLSTTLVSLTLDPFSHQHSLDDTLHQLFDSSLPNLQVLKLLQWLPIMILETLRILTPSEDEYRNKEINRLPNLRSLTIITQINSTCEHQYEFPRAVLDFLGRRRVGEIPRFHLDFKLHRALVTIWSPELRGELNRVVRGRQVDVEQQSIKIEWA